LRRRLWRERRAHDAGFAGGGPRARPGGASRLKKLKLAFEQKGIVCEEAATPERARGSVVVVAGLTPDSGAESLRIRFTGGKGKQALLVTGGDDRGLMYGLLDVADRVGWARDPKNPLSEVRRRTRSPPWWSALSRCTP